ncbi:MAG: helix-turn-helix domain-containing protein [Porticoccaceae bacterium]|nr:helix-turn-helix domain-containing protein [Porticoccaceae bacterium]
MGKLQKLKQQALQNPEVRQEYDALSEEFQMIDKLLQMRSAAGLTQDEVARRMGTQKSNVCRLEKGNANPSWNTLRKYAHACGFQITMGFHTA